MKLLLNLILVAFAIQCMTSSAPALASPGFRKVMTIIFENTNYQDALDQPTLGKLARDGALLTRFTGETHPSQSNYISLTAGDGYNVGGDNPVTLDVKHVADLLEAKGRSWKIYLEGYPGSCFTGKSSGDYVRKHNPFISFKNIQTDLARCNAHLVNSEQLARDVQNGTLPDYSMYIPDLKNDGHDTGVAFADRWFARAFGPLLKDSHFMQGMLLVTTFDESGVLGGNHIYTSLYGDSVIAGSTSDVAYNHYSILRTIEDTFGLGSLGRQDAKAPVISGVWK